MNFNDPARASTLLLTSLMVIGLVFFIRASTKDRIEVAQFGSVQEADALRQAVIKYFYSRTYQPPDQPPDDRAKDASDSFSEVAVSSKKSGPTIVNGTTLVGMVSPSLFLAVFLSALAAVGFACLSLVVATLFPSWGEWLLILVAASPLAGVFYWKKSSRPETVVLRVDSLPAAGSAADKAENKWLSKLTVKGHRDELADLERAFSQPELKAWAGLEKM